MEMKTIVLLVIAAVASADKRCHGIYIDNRYYNLDILKEGINHLQDLAINRNDNGIFFTFEDLTGAPSSLVCHFDIYSRNATVIDGVRDVTAIAIDQFYGKVYVGGSNGLFKINERNIPERLPIQDDIEYMYFKDVLYFINRNKEAYKFEDGFATPVQELRGIRIDKFVIDDDNNLFFTQNNQLFRIKLGTRAVNTHENLTPNCLVTDAYSKVYICTNKGLYIYNKYKYVFDKIANLNNLKTITFNKMNEPIYAVFDYLVKLNISPIGCFED